MNTYYINYKFNKMCLNTLDEKYLDKINFNNESLIYLYTNVIEISKFYSLYHPTYKNISLYSSFNDDPMKLVKRLIIYIKNNGYYEKDILLLYSIVSYIVIKNSSFFNELTLKDDFKYSKNNNYYKLFPQSHKFDLYILDTLDKVLAQEYNVLESRIYLDKSLDKYNKYIKHPLLISLEYHLENLFKKNKSLNLKYNSLKNYTDKEIDENLSMILNDYTKLIDIVNQALYYIKVEKIDEYFKDKMELVKH